MYPGGGSACAVYRLDVLTGLDFQARHVKLLLRSVAGRFGFPGFSFISYMLTGYLITGR